MATTAAAATETKDSMDNNNNNIQHPTRVLRDYLSDSRVWKDFLTQGGFVAGDIIVVDPFKAGTTFTQRIIQQILSNCQESAANLSDSSPWLDCSWGKHQQMLDALQVGVYIGVCV